ncbi:MAG TPA: LON peptidase substrate-binding domain-containing protein [Holophagaceae bacterium]|nr:LON peptidase substrate-binding domain-containing protein [Holophagaceae bacterium]
MLPPILPLFPLPRMVLFPHTFVPLHVFEPRYRQMTSDILASHHHFVMALAREDAENGSDLLQGDAPIFEIATLARVVRAEPMDDGRWNLLVQGRSAVRILEEVEGLPYRQAKVQELPFEVPGPLENHARAALLKSLHAYAAGMDLMPQIKQLLDLQLSDEVMLNTLAMALDFEPVEKQFLLEAPSLPAMCDRLHQLLDFASQDRDLPENGM